MQQKQQEIAVEQLQSIEGAIVQDTNSIKETSNMAAVKGEQITRGKHTLTQKKEKENTVKEALDKS